MDALLWSLIADEGDAISKYYAFLESDFVKSSDGEPFAALALRIIEEKRGHVDALKYLFDATTKSKPHADTPEFARTALSDWRDKNKLIK